MKRFLLSFILLGCFIQLEAQERTANDTILLLEDKIWKAEIPSEKSYTQEMEFRDCGLYATFTYNEKKVTMEDSYHICGDTIKTYYKKEYKILELNSTYTVSRTPSKTLPLFMRTSPRMPGLFVSMMPARNRSMYSNVTMVLITFRKDCSI